MRSRRLLMIYRIVACRNNSWSNWRSWRVIIRIWDVNWNARFRRVNNKGSNCCCKWTPCRRIMSWWSSSTNRRSMKCLRFMIKYCCVCRLYSSLCNPVMSWCSMCRVGTMISLCCEPQSRIWVRRWSWWRRMVMKSYPIWGWTWRSRARRIVSYRSWRGRSSFWSRIWRSHSSGPRVNWSWRRRSMVCRLQSRIINRNWSRVWRSRWSRNRNPRRRSRGSKFWNLICRSYE